MREKKYYVDNECQKNSFVRFLANHSSQFHFSGEFSLLTLGLFFVFFFLLSCWTYGSSVPSGLFVPCILCGASYGRFIANLLHVYGS